MAIRTTSSAVQAILGNEYDANISITPFIETASNMVDRVCDTSASLYTSADLELIERWLAAHFYAIAKKASAQERAGSVGENYQFRLGLNLNVTMWGQQALAIDTEGGLAEASLAAEKGGKPRLTVKWLGTSDETEAGTL